MCAVIINSKIHFYVHFRNTEKNDAITLSLTGWRHIYLRKLFLLITAVGFAIANRQNLLRDVVRQKSRN